MTSTIPLATRVLDAFPSGQYGLIGLLRILDIVESDVVETAAIECTTLPLMRLNPTFVATFAQTAEKLMMLIMHELHHLLLGHTRLFERPTPAHNLVFDAVINAMLCRMFPQPEFTSFLTGFYDAERFPECMLRPPPNWKPEVRAAAPPALEPRLQDLYRALYSETGAGYDELFEALVTEVRCVALPVLLGDHGEELPQLDSSPVLFDAVRDCRAMAAAVASDSRAIVGGDVAVGKRDHTRGEFRCSRAGNVDPLYRACRNFTDSRVSGQYDGGADRRRKTRPPVGRAAGARHGVASISDRVRDAERAR